MARSREPCPHPQPLLRRWRLLPTGDGDPEERGSATLEMAVLGPALILLSFVFVQAALYYHANALVAAAARQGATAARSYTATPQAGPAAARAFLSAHAGDSVTHPVISTTGTTIDLVSVTVEGTALSILPGLSGPHVTHTAQAPRERLTAPTPVPGTAGARP